MPVNTQYGFNEIEKLQSALLDKSLFGKNLWLAWEHKELVNIEKGLLQKLRNDPMLVPAWSSDDFDRIDVITIQRIDDQFKSVNYRQDQESLNDLSSACPQYLRQ